MENATILAYKAESYSDYVQATEDFVMYHRLSDLIKMLDNGIACNMYTQEELKKIIAEQDELTQKILIAQFGKYITM